eukprot:TRINITY_DN53409_c0_g1_i1.p1 TRINITY_DN53409_c0_g1~~TRINITY_DN53409_c0_g1_i1.p1  ORF type:complete len:279 (-),score=53.33 TRINITY_DN53409_c0_g1_i1:127-846(-)
MLGQQLDAFSERMKLQMKAKLQAADSDMTAEDADSFAQSASEEISSKHFLHDTDRRVAVEIMRKFVTRRALADAITSGNNEEVGKILSALAKTDRHECRKSLEEPVDAKCNTLLHVAVAKRNVLASTMLLEYGANPDLRNWHGDKPDEWRLFWRLGKAAAACRTRRKHLQSGSAVDLFDTLNTPDQGSAIESESDCSAGACVGSDTAPCQHTDGQRDDGANDHFPLPGIVNALPATEVA